MPYIPPQNRPPIDRHVDALAGKIAGALARNDQTAEISVLYRKAFAAVADSIAALEKGEQPAEGEAGALAACIVDTAQGYAQKGAWTGEYEAAQITKSGDCYSMVPFHTRLVPMERDGVDGYIEIMLKHHEPEGPAT